MRNILVLTSVYPGEGMPSTTTPVVHYFCREWVKMGYKVRVIHNCAYFPALYYHAPSFVKSIMSLKFGCVLPEIQLDKPIDYELDGVSVSRVPYKKWIPGSVLSHELYLKQASSISDKLKETNFRPDVIISHWANPQLFLAYKLKCQFRVPSVAVLHENGAILGKMPETEAVEHSVDLWGYRSLTIKNEFESLYGKKEKTFRCYSGIPQYYLENIPSRDCSKVRNYIFVGLLIQRKYPDCVIKALAEYYGKEEFNLDIVGSGILLPELENQVKELQISDYVQFTGRLPREEVKERLDKADVFVMISRREVFGLVYLEAMARGCIVIASRNEGMQGIVEHGVNGFLCSAGDAQELKNIIETINSLSPEERKQISDNAIQTSRRFTDSAVAKDYMENICNKLGL